MRITKGQLKLINMLELSGGMFRAEISEQQYPKSLVESLVKKGLVCEFKGKLTSATNTVTPNRG